MAGPITERAHAGMLRDRIAEFWRAQGAEHVRVWVEVPDERTPGHASELAIRSNLINALPPKK
jgi:hypothetical protein